MDDNNPLPEDLSTLTDDDLAKLQTQIDDRGSELRESAEKGEITDDTVTEIEHLADKREALRGERDRRDGEVAERSTRATAALGRLAGEEPTVADEEDVEEPDGAEVVAARVDGQSLAASGADSTGLTSRTATTAAVARRSPSQLAAARPDANRPKPQRKSEQFMRATGYAPVREGTELLDRFDVAKMLCEASNRMGQVPTGVTGDRVSMAFAQKELDGRMLSNDPTLNFGILRDAVEAAVTRSRGEEALVAGGGGGYCNIYTPVYDFYRLAEPQDPIESDLPTIPAPRAGIQYMQPMDWHTALGAVGTQTKAQNTANQVKSVLCMTCPSILTAEVIAIYQIVCFDNLQYRVFPEQAEAFLQDVAVAFSFTKESYFLSQIAAKSTTVSGPTTYGANRSLFWDWVTAATEYRKRNAMRRDATLKLYAPDWSLDMIKLDEAMDATEGLNFRGATDAQAIAEIRAQNLDPVFYNDLTTTGTGIARSQAAGNLNAWPQTATSYLFSPGSFGKLDGGSLDVGLVRDSMLNGTNNVQFFMEEWLGVAFLGIESIRLVSKVCPSGAAPATVTPITC
jgi:hypothetical protein